MIVTNRDARQWDQVQHQAMLRRIAKQRQEDVAAYLKSNPTAAAPENPGIASPIPHAARDAGLGFGQGRLF